MKYWEHTPAPSPEFLAAAERVGTALNWSDAELRRLEEIEAEVQRNDEALETAVACELCEELFVPVVGLPIGDQTCPACMGDTSGEYTAAFWRPAAGRDQRRVACDRASGIGVSS